MVEGAQYPEIAELMRRLGGDRSKALLAEWMEDKKLRGHVHIDDTFSASQILMDMIFGAVVSKTGDGPEWPGHEDRKSHLRRCIRIFVHGVASPQSE